MSHSCHCYNCEWEISPSEFNHWYFKRGKTSEFCEMNWIQFLTGWDLMVLLGFSGNKWGINMSNISRTLYQDVLCNPIRLKLRSSDGWAIAMKNLLFCSKCGKKMFFGSEMSHTGRSTLRLTVNCLDSNAQISFWLHPGLILETSFWTS